MAWNHQVTTFLIWTNVHQIITRRLSDAVWHYKGLMSWWSFWVTKKDFMTNELKHWKYLKVIDVMVIPLCPKTPADPILGTHNGACGYACLHGIACHTTISIIWHIKKVLNHVKWGVELKMNWLNWSIPISSGFQFQFNSNSKSFNSIPIQFMLNWIELIINSNSIHELIRALPVRAGQIARGLPRETCCIKQYLCVGLCGRSAWCLGIHKIFWI